MNQTDLLTSQKMQLYNTLIEPVLNYWSEIWGNHKAPEVESILLPKPTLCEAIY